MRRPAWKGGDYTAQPPAYTTALGRLQDQVEPFPFEQVEELVQSELGSDTRHLFAEFNREPLAAASLGQVHRATLRSGREVAVKVQRPTAREDVVGDMEILTSLAAVADKRTDLGRTYGFSELLREFERSLRLELDYRREARNLARFGKIVRRYDRLVVPDPVPDLSTGRVLTMRYVEGRKVTDLGPLALMDLDTEPIVEQLFRAYLRSILHEGFLHADPHPGNLLVMPDGRLAILDLGMVVNVPPRIQDRVLRLLMATRSRGTTPRPSATTSPTWCPRPWPRAPSSRPAACWSSSAGSRAATGSGRRPRCRWSARRCSTSTAPRSTSTPASPRPRRSATT